jgi:hypothetical protein
VDGRSRAEEKTFAARKLTPSEKAPQTRERCLRQKTPLTYRAAVLVLQPQLLHLVADVDVVVVVGQREGRAAEPE